MDNFSTHTEYDVEKGLHQKLESWWLLLHLPFAGWIHVHSSLKVIARWRSEGGESGFRKRTLRRSWFRFPFKRDGKWDSERWVRNRAFLWKKSTEELIILLDLKGTRIITALQGKLMLMLIFSFTIIITTHLCLIWNWWWWWRRRCSRGSGFGI